MLKCTYCPDKNPGKEEESAKQTSRLNNAYEILMNAVERRDFEERFFGSSQQPSAPGGVISHCIHINPILLLFLLGLSCDSSNVMHASSISAVIIKDHVSITGAGLATY